MLNLEIRAGFDDFTLELHSSFPARGISAVFGRSGSGKSTLLRCIAGLQPCDGRISFGDEIWLDTQAGVNVPPHRRSVGFVFQDARLFSHLDVAGNLQFASKRAPRPHTISEQAVLDTLRLQNLLHRDTNGLSGGERQRVALGRTLLSQPKLLLLDEPLSALDLSRKAELLPYISSISETFAIPALFVSHAIDEVAQLAQHTLVLDDGAVQITGPTLEVLEHPDLQHITGRNESGAVLSGRVHAYDEAFQLVHIQCAGQDLVVPTLQPPASERHVNLFVRARDVSVATAIPERSSVRNVLHGKLTSISAQPDTPFAELVIDVGGQLLHARVTRAAVADLGLRENDAIYALIKSVSFDQGGTQ
jgi:molybdate transport system ATP-binding protein